MAYSSSTVPEEHWQVKNRKAFKKARERLKRDYLKSGKRRKALDPSKVQTLENRKKKILLYFGFVFLLILAASSISAGFIINLIFAEKPPVYKVQSVIHGTPAIEKDNVNMPFWKKVIWHGIKVISRRPFYGLNSLIASLKTGGEKNMLW